MAYVENKRNMNIENIKKEDKKQKLVIKIPNWQVPRFLFD